MSLLMSIFEKHYPLLRLRGGDVAYHSNHVS